MIAARPPEMPAVMWAGPMKMLRATWLATTEATATSVNRVKRTPTLLRALRISAAPIRLDASAIDVLGYVTNDKDYRRGTGAGVKCRRRRPQRPGGGGPLHRPPSRLAARYRVATACAANGGFG